MYGSYSVMHTSYRQCASAAVCVCIGTAYRRSVLSSSRVKLSRILRLYIILKGIVEIGPKYGVSGT